MLVAAFQGSTRAGGLNHSLRFARKPHPCSLGRFSPYRVQLGGKRQSDAAYLLMAMVQDRRTPSPDVGFNESVYLFVLGHSKERLRVCSLTLADDSEVNVGSIVNEQEAAYHIALLDPVSFLHGQH